ncbi:MAG: hypothetical protein Q8867_01125 [Bacteroidota bacterium]|nr:hypothetical protein [Bacteroidota bacterium]
MKKIFCFFLLSCFYISSFSQDTINRKDNLGNKQGYWRKLDSTGKKVYDGHFLNNIPIGEFHYYYPNGKLKARSLMTGNGTRSQFTSFFKNGFKMAEGVFVNEKREGLWKFYSEYDGALVSEENYKIGIKEGDEITYYPSGGKSDFISWKNGKKTGSWVQYYQDGKIKLKGMYLDDLREGPVEAFFLSGQKIFTGQYHKGDPDGIWIYYNEKGEITRKESYEKGIRIKLDILIPDTVPEKGIEEEGTERK